MEGLEAPLTLGSAEGAIHATYQGDRIWLQLEPSGVERFLVVNELYHPNWHAYAGNTELKVWPTNIVMRGIMVPPGVTEIEMRFVPFMVTWVAGAFVVAGLVLTAVGWVALRRLDRMTATRTAVTKPLAGSVDGTGAAPARASGSSGRAA